VRFQRPVDDRRPKVALLRREGFRLQHAIRPVGAADAGCDCSRRGRPGVEHGPAAGFDLYQPGAGPRWKLPRTMKTGPKPLPLEVRLERNSIPEPNSGCCLWLGAVAPNGYGTTNIGGRSGVTRGAHQAAWIARHGAIPRGMFVCHQCDVKICINPDHLYLGTPAQNSADAIARDRVARGEARRNAKLSDDMVRTIWEMHGARASSRVIGNHVGVDSRHVRKVLDGSIWGHVSR